MATKKCPSHNDRPLDYRCFEPVCKASPYACVICLKKSHRWCSYEHILFEKAQYSQSIPEFPVNSLVNPLKQLTVEKLDPVLPLFRESLQRLTDLTLISPSASTAAQAQALRRVDKHLYDIEFNSETSKITLKQKKIGEEDLKEAAEMLELSIDGVISQLMAGLGEISLRAQEGPSPDDFRMHESLSLTQFMGNFHLMSLNPTPDYYCCVTKKPIKNKVVVKVKVQLIDPANRFMEIGLMTHADFSADPDNFVLNSSYGPYSFSGFAKTGFDGALNTSDPTSDSGLKEGTEFTFTYDRSEKSVSIIGDSNINLTADLSSADEDYHLYFLLHSHHQSIQFEYLLDPPSAAPAPAPSSA